MFNPLNTEFSRSRINSVFTVEYYNLVGAMEVGLEAVVWNVVQEIRLVIFCGVAFMTLLI